MSGDLIKFESSKGNSESTSNDLEENKPVDDLRLFLIGFRLPNGDESCFSILADSYEHAHRNLDCIRESSYVIGELDYIDDDEENEETS